MNEQPYGYILVDKPLDWTSFDVVAKTRGMLRKHYSQKIKVGHTGTLDPLATGLLVLLVGRATKQAERLTKQDKWYEVEITLGQTSSTDDNEGEKTVVSDVEPSDAEVEAAINSYIGEIDQTPPAFSAIKIDGKRAYKLAREGKEVKIDPRKVTIHSIESIEYSYPKVKFRTHVSSGTYIRSLARDVGESLATGAHMSELRRTQIDSFMIADANTIDSMNSEIIHTLIKPLE